MRAISLALFLTALVPLTPALADEIPGSQFNPGNWSGAAYTDDSGKFAYCSVSVGYTNGETFWLGLYPNDTLAVLLSHPNVRFRPGEQFQVTMMMESGMPWSGNGEAWDEAFAGITWEGVQVTADYLSGGQWFRMLGIGIDEGYDVQGIAEALVMAQDCLARNSSASGLGTAPGKRPLPKVPDLTKPRTGGVGAGATLGTPAPKVSP